MEMKKAVPVLPAGDVEVSLRWWVECCGFTEAFRDATPPGYAGMMRGDVWMHLAKVGKGVDGAALAQMVGEQTMVRLMVSGIEELYAEFQERGGRVHPNGPLQTKPWGAREFGAIDPGGVCVTFAEL